MLHILYPQFCGYTVRGWKREGNGDYSHGAKLWKSYWFVERFSLGVRNPTTFLAGAMDISPECFLFSGVCCGGLVTLPYQLGIGFLLRERPVFALATVATVVGIWTVFPIPYALAALTALFLYLRSHYFS